MPAPFRLEFEDGAVAVGQGHGATLTRVVRRCRRATPRKLRVGPRRRAERRRGARTKPPHVAGSTGGCARRREARVGRSRSRRRPAARCSRCRRSRPARAMCGQHPRGRDHERRVARRERGELGERVRLGGITAHEDRRIGGRDVERRIDPRRATLLPRPHQAHEEAPVVGIRGIERSEVDARTPHDVRHPQRRIAGDRAHASTTVDAPSRGSRSGPPPYRYE